MNSRHDNARLRASRSRAFTILELLVAVSVMTLIIYVLYALFNQTQMALRKNASQVDVNEGGRAAMEMIVRELSQMEVSGYPAITDLQTLLTYSGSKSFLSRTTPGNLPLRLAGVSEDEMNGPVDDMIDWVGLGASRDARPETLSGGEQQRVAIARAIAPRPDLIFADEPTGNLDAATGHEIVDLLFARRAETGATLLVITHDPELAKQCDRVIQLGDGVIASDTKR